MSRDIRSFFNVVSKKPGGSVTKQENKVHKSAVLPVSDDFIEQTPNKNSKYSKIKSSKRKVQIISSDSEDEKEEKRKSPKKSKVQEDKLQPVNIDDIFSNKPIHQSKVDPLPATKPSPVKSPSKAKKKSKKRGNPETEVHGDENFEKTLLDLDDDLILENVEFLDKTIHEALRKAKEKSPQPKSVNYEDKGLDKKKHHKNMEVRLGTKYPQCKNNELEEKVHTIDSKKHHKTSEGKKKMKSPQHEVNILEETIPQKSQHKKRQRKNSEEATPKKTKFDHSDSGIDPDQEAFEKKRYSSMLYQKYLQRGGPKHHGEKELPKGKPNCLSNITFLRTGVLDSLDGEEFENLVKEHGGRVVHAVSKKVNFLVVGEDPGPAKLDKARGYNILEINENDFLDMILIKSGMKPIYSKHKSDVSEESGIEVEVNEHKEDHEKKDKKERSRDQSIESKSGKRSEKPNFSKLTRSPLKSDTVKEEKKTPNIWERKPTSITTKTEIESKKLEVKSETEVEEIETAESKLENIESWTEKYKPKDMKAIIGQQDPSSNMNKLKKWLLNWYRNQLPEVRKKIPRPSPWAKNDDGAYYKAVLLSGSPGVGKTTTATVVAQALGFDIVEFNASDTRSKKLLHEEVAQLLSTTSIAGFATGHEKTTTKKRVLLMDEVDGMAGNEDRGGIQELINLIKNTHVPIICMCNDRNHQKMRSLVNYCFDLRFTKPKLEQIRGAMMSICFKEGIKITPNALTEVINGASCDIRQTLNNLFMWSASNKNISVDTASKESKAAKKDTIMGPWEVVRAVFSESEQKNMSLSDKSRLFFFDYSLGPLFVQENYLNVTPHCPKKEIMKRVYLTADAISRGDLIDSKIRSSNNWALLESQAMFSSVLPGYYMSGNITSRINFPGWLGKNSSTNKHKRLLSELYMHTRVSTSGCRLAMKLDYLKSLRDAIITPLKNYGTEGVHEAIEVMKAYNLLREDLTNLLELCQWKNMKNPFNDIDAKVKSAFTRMYNKEGPLLPFASSNGVSKRKAVNIDDTLMEEQEIESDDEQVDDDVTADTMIKIKKKEKHKESTKAGTSKGKETTKGSKGKSKKTK